MMKVAIGSDHAGFEAKQNLLAWPQVQWVDCGTKNVDSVDYPDFADLVCKKVLQQEVEFGVLICGSGQGMAMRANRWRGIRAALCWSVEVAKLARGHNSANVLCLGARTMDTSLFPKVVEAFLTQEFAGGRHQNRVGKLDNLTT